MARDVLIDDLDFAGVHRIVNLPDPAAAQQAATKAYVDAGVAPAANAVVGVAANYKIARSAAPVALDGGNPTSVAHGLTTCVAAFAQLTGSVAPGVSTSVLTVVINGANLDIYGWKPTSNADPTLIASAGTESFSWVAVGT